jgi:phage replication-related protein YjqB (UPF0714/DUF867 family)
MGKYCCFEQLSANESKGADYEVRRRHGSPAIAVISIHGGRIEPGTSEVAEAIAGAEHTFYTFRGIKKAGNKDLHITGTLFDEPDALEIARCSETIISIHGCSENEEVVYVGGIDFRLRECIEQSLQQAGFKTLHNRNAGLGGLDRRNICNRCRRGMGVQLEISKGLRARMFGDLPHGTGLPCSGTFQEFIRAVRNAIEQFILSSEAID